MAEALFSFDDVDAAKHAADRVARALPANAVVLHAGDDVPPNERVPKAVDEQVSGGLLSNVYELFQGVFDWDASPHGATGEHAQALARGGAVVRVRAVTDLERRRVDDLMQGLGAMARSPWHGT